MLKIYVWKNISALFYHIYALSALFYLCYMKIVRCSTLLVVLYSTLTTTLVLYSDLRFSALFIVRYSGVPCGSFRYSVG